MSKEDNGFKRIFLCSLSSVLGGVELRMGMEARVLRQHGYLPTVGVNLHPQLDRWAQELKTDGIPLIDFDPPPILEQWLWWQRTALSRLPFAVRGQYTLWRIARAWNKQAAKVQSTHFFSKIRPDLVHIFLPWTDFGGTRLWLAHHHRLPVVLSVRNSFRPTSINGWRAVHYRQAFRSVMGVYAISQGAMDHFLAIFGEFVLPNTVMPVIHNSVDTVQFRPDPRRRVQMRRSLGIPEDALIMGVVARLEIQKQPDALITIFSELKKMFPSLFLVLVGSGSMESALKAQADRLGVRSTVIFTGWQRNVEQLLPGFDLAVQISRREGFGTSTAEAMACGLPVVGTDIAGTRDILTGGKGGVLVSLGDNTAFKDACATILADENLRSKLGREAREEAVAKYSQSGWNEKIMNFYENVEARAKQSGYGSN